MISRRAIVALAALAAAPARAEKPDPLARRFGGPFQLTAHDGRRVTDADFRGRGMLVYFGFSNCADTCPGDLQTISTALDQLATGELAKLQPLFVTVDPEHDTPEAMADYLKAFHPAILGLTGSQAEIAGAAKAYRVHRRLLRIAPEKRSGGLIHLAHAGQAKPYRGGQWTIDHGSLIYLMGREGEFLTLFPRGADAGSMAGVIKGYIGKARI